MSMADADLVYKTRRWERWLWKEHLDQSEQAAQVVSDGQRKCEAFEALPREMFSRLYADQPEKLEQSAVGSAWAERAHEEAEQLPEFQQLKARCVGDQLWSGMAATTVTEQLLAIMPEPKGDQPIPDAARYARALDGLRRMAEEGSVSAGDVSGVQGAMEEAKGAAEQMANGMAPEMIRQAFRRACEQAQEEITEAQDSIESYGCGCGAGAAGKGGDIAKKRQILEKIAGSKKLARIADLAGRMRATAAQKQASKVSNAQDEVTDIEQGTDLSRVLPSELALLARPATRGEFARRLYEGALLCYQLRGREKMKRGPIVVCVDNSGSMSGTREIWSKAVALGLMEVARIQKRAFALIHFDTAIGMTLRIMGPEDAAARWNEVLEAMEFFSGGGTDFEPALKEALGIIEADGVFSRADVILVSDGYVGDHYAERYRQRSENLGVVTYGILIGSDCADSMKAFCDESVAIQDLTEDASVTDLVFSI